MSSLNPREVIGKLFKVVDAFESQLKKEQHVMDNYTLKDIQAINANHETISAEYFSCLAMVEADDILMKLSKEEVEKVRLKIANIAGILRVNREKLIQVEEQQSAVFKLLQQSKKKNSTFYNHFGKQVPLTIATWKESV